MDVSLGKRVWVVGCPGAGKTTLARRIAGASVARHVELDALYWGTSWRASSESDFRAKVETLTNPETWVVDGEYAVVRDLLCERCDAVVWLDPPLGTIAYRVLRRGIGNVARRRELWNGNRETFTRLFSNVLPYAIKMHGVSRVENARLIARLQGNKPWLRLSSA